MMNKALKEYMENLHSKDANYQEILNKMKGVSKMKTISRNILNVAAVILVILLVGTVSTQIYAKIQWDIKFKEYQNRDFEVGTGAIKEAIEDGYNEEVEMDYIEQDGIGAKVDSLVMTDDCFEANISFNFSDDILLDSEMFSFGYAVYDDQKNIYGVEPRMHIGKKEKYDYYTPYMYKEIGVEYNKKDIYAIQLNDASGRGNISAEGRNIKSQINMSSSKGFPRSKKIYIRVFDLGYSMTQVDTENNTHKMSQAEDFTITNSEWIFEIDLPEKFYDRETTKLKLKDDIPGLQIEKITVTELGLVIRGNLEGFNELIKLGIDMPVEEWKNKRNETMYITDEDGNTYYENSIGTISSRKRWI